MAKQPLQKKKIYHEAGPTLEQGALRRHRVSIPGDAPNPTGHGPEQADGADSALSRGLS